MRSLTDGVEHESSDSQVHSYKAKGFTSCAEPYMQYLILMMMNLLAGPLTWA